MATQSDQLSETLARASLSETERRALEGLVARLRDELGDDLHAVWLYGSRARGEANPYETDPDRMSDIDLMVLVDASRGWDPYGAEVMQLVEEIAAAEGLSPVWFSPFVRDPEWLKERREIRSFFIQEVDRDKLILHGSALE
jgi:predicted nucleotidyltransferase